MVACGSSFKGEQDFSTRTEKPSFDYFCILFHVKRAILVLKISILGESELQLKIRSGAVVATTVGLFCFHIKDQ